MCGIVLTRRFYYEKSHNRRSGQVLCGLRKRWKMDRLAYTIHEGRLRGRGRMSQKTFVDRDYSLVSETHFSVLQHLMIVEPYIDEHLSELRRDNTDHTDA
jgi:hypothetical protein